jgi:leader peptidase (prepilin peptidase)/N-methyltransferase
VLLGVVGAIVGAGWGLVSDRIAARWPAHPDGSRRSPGWRTAVAVGAGALALRGVGERFGGSAAEDPLVLLLFGGYAVTLVLLLAVDLDQRLLPDRLTLPWIPLALAAGLLGANPLVGDGLAGAIVVALAIPLGLFLLSIPFGSGAIGMGDLKLLVSVGLLAGAERALTGLLAGALLGGLVIGALLVTRRIGARSYVPFGPFLIAGALWAILLP